MIFTLGQQCLATKAGEVVTASRWLAILSSSLALNRAICAQHKMHCLAAELVDRMGTGRCSVALLDCVWCSAVVLPCTSMCGQCVVNYGHRHVLLVWSISNSTG